MKFVNNIKIGDKRIIKKFALFPVKVITSNKFGEMIKSETRFMETVTIEQMYMMYPVYGLASNWNNIRFIDKI